MQSRNLLPVDLPVPTLLEAAPDAMIITDHDGRILLVNRQAEVLFGYDRQELVGQPVEVLIPERYRGPHLAHRAMYAAAPRTRPMGAGLELYGLRKDGSEFPVEVSLSPVATDNGRVVIAAVRDASERKRAEAEREELLRRERLARAEVEAALQLRDQVLSTVSHDLGQPLAAARIGVRMLRRLAQAGQLTPEALAQVELIETAVRRMSVMIDELRDMARIQSGRSLELEYQPTDLVALARREVGLWQQMTAHHRITVNTDLTELVGEWDERRLERVLSNLLDNAIKYSPEGGDIVVTVRRTPPDGSACSWAELTVTDQGLGIPVDDLPHIFDRFHRARNVIGRVAGTGLGLVAAKQIVEQHGGQITVTSREAQGTTVTVRLPITVETVDN
jgi:two-component system sensor kinase FixL